jgi:hypothetical protein
MTELLANLEGMERGPAGNTSLAAAFALAREVDEDKIIVVQETEYTGAGKHIQPQLSFARKNGIKIFFGDPVNEIPGQNIIFPSSPELIKLREIDMDSLKKSYIRNALENNKIDSPDELDIKFLSNDTKSNPEYVTEVIKKIKEG